ncbi:MAG: hypothetical protein ACYDAQ_01930 [Mycobacteriales bacterium]
MGMRIAVDDLEFLQVPLTVIPTVSVGVQRLVVQGLVLSGCGLGSYHRLAAAG